MKISLLCIGKTNSKELIALIHVLEKRLPSYIAFERKEIPDIKNAKNLSEIELKLQEYKLLQSEIQPTDFIILLDEKGKEYTSVDFSKYLQHHMSIATKRLVFIIGGAYGFHPEMHNQGQGKLSLSKMTFTHQMIRLFFVEQLYRGYSILEGKPYHNEG